MLQSLQIENLTKYEYDCFNLTILSKTWGSDENKLSMLCPAKCVWVIFTVERMIFPLQWKTTRSPSNYEPGSLFARGWRPAWSAWPPALDSLWYDGPDRHRTYSPALLETQETGMLDTFIEGMCRMCKHDHSYLAPFPDVSTTKYERFTSDIKHGLVSGLEDLKDWRDLLFGFNK